MFELTKFAKQKIQIADGKLLFKIFVLKNVFFSIKEEFKESQLHAQPFIASLRAGLLMALHESEHQEMVSSDSVRVLCFCSRYFHIVLL